MQLREPLTKMVVHLRYIQGKTEVGHDLFEGEVSMSQQQADTYKQLVGDGQASVTASAELSEMDYGNGGKVFVSVTLTVDQSKDGLEAGIGWAKHLAQSKVWEAHDELKNQLRTRGILR